MSKVAKLVINKDDMVFFNYISVDRVVQGKRIRDIDEKTVCELVESFKQFGVLEPITVTQDGGIYTVLAGHHRWLAFLRLLEQAGDNKSDYCMPAIRVFINKDDEEALQLAENLHRNDLKQKEREIMAERYAVLVGSRNPVANSNTGATQKTGANPTRIKSPFREWYETCGLTEEIARRMFKEWSSATGNTTSAGKMTAEQIGVFGQWRIDQREAEEKVEEERKRLSDDVAKAEILKTATKAYETAQGIYLRACDVAQKAGVPNVKYI